MLLDGKKLLITGVLTDDSIAYAAAQVALENGAEILLTNVGKGVRLTEKVAKRLPTTPDVMQMDVNAPDDISAVAEELTRRWGRVDGVLHGIAFAPQDALGGNFMTAPWESVAIALQTSTYSLKALTAGLLEPLKVAGADARRSGREPDLRRPLRLADLRLDGRGQGRSRGDDALPRARPRPARDPGQHRLGRTDPHDGRQEHPRLRRDRGHLGRALAARLVAHRCDAGRPDVRVPPVRLGLDDDRRDDPRRRRLPRHGCAEVR